MRTEAVAMPPLAPDVAARWKRLGNRVVPGFRFDPSMLQTLPAPVQRWLQRTVAPGAALTSRAVLTMHGTILIGRPRRFAATQLLAPPDGFIWAATAKLGPLRLSGFDRFTEEEGEMRWRLLGLVPVMSATGVDVTRSAAGRLAGEAFLLPPTALAPWCRWEPESEDRAIAHVRCGGESVAVTTEVDDDGALRSLSFARWGDPDGKGDRMAPFGVVLGQPVDRSGIAVPSTVTAGWGWGDPGWEDGAFFRAAIDRVDWCGVDGSVRQ